MTRKRVLIAGESWTVHSIHQKGFDSFTTTEYEEGVGALRDALLEDGWDVAYQPSHVAATSFPATPDELGAYDCVILSDIGANTLLLHPRTFKHAEARPDRLVALREWVAGGGALIMVGGYLTFQGIDAKARYHGSPVEEALPVTMSPYDDRVERPAGVLPEVTLKDHEVVAGLDATWPALLGYNAVTPRPEAEVLATVGADPLLVVGHHGAGRSVAFTSDCGPHWAPHEFLSWSGYNRLWQQMAAWSIGA
ncbi:glutamine amidotransferase [Dactylosporangium sp. AC04546]|uniref:glutamine amidotransferase n=1 Tax=Dactylosporangium sp. AC04546 TaxID=2862460 RepID=UPI001EDF7C48|nr:glutamine amidotransferase [Dactylosporangium sp. AC04546]WVK89036.1 glutamine amidotransferase [Dactylosporangium sp. AC04546]